MKVVVGVFDSAVQAYGQPVFVPAIGAALRSFVDEVNKRVDGNALAAHPEDFELRYLAHFDEEDGRFFVDDKQPSVIARGKDVVQSEN